MRTAPGKEMGYIICPILIPPNADPEQWLSTSNMEEGWQELGQILLALRAHDQRIEDNLADLLNLYLPKPPELQRTIVAVANREDKRIQYREHEGPPRQAQSAVERVLDGKSTLAKEFRPISDTESAEPPPSEGTTIAAEASEQIQRGGNESNSDKELPHIDAAKQPVLQPSEPTQIITGKKNDDGSSELRMGTVARGKPAPDGTRGKVDIKKCKAKAKDMINKGEGVRLSPSGKQRRTQEEIAEQSAMQMLMLSGMEEHGNAIKMNLLSKSGLADNHVVRDLNILESSVKEAAHHMKSDGLLPVLDSQFGLDNLKKENQQAQKQTADGCTIAALLMMNAAMLHQRISDGGWLSGISDLSVIKNDVGVVARTRREWERIMRHDFRPVLEPAVEVIYAIEEIGKLAGLERALRHLAAEAERIAATYADMGADHAGPLFNEVMGNQASDGAYFTRPTAASIAARLTLDVVGNVDWTNEQVWREHKIVDLACGSGTLLAAMLTDMKRRAAVCGADEQKLADLQKLAVEDTIHGLDFNPVSLQLAASQLTAGNREIRYRRMGLHQMPYGPHRDDPHLVSTGTLELLGQKAVIPQPNELGLPDQQVGSQAVWSSEGAELEDAVSAVLGSQVAIMNPPFTSRRKMGEKFPLATKAALQRRVDQLERLLVRSDKALTGVSDKNSIEPLFVALADHCLDSEKGVLTMINPTVALTASSAQLKRQLLAERYHIHTVLTCHQPRQVNMSQQTGMHESIIVMRRHRGLKPPTRFIHLDKMPLDMDQLEDLHKCLSNCDEGSLNNGWGEVSQWPTDRVEAGNWTAGVWRSPNLAEAANAFASHEDLQSIDSTPGLNIRITLQEIHAEFEPADADAPGSFPVLQSKSAQGQTSITSRPDEYRLPKERNENVLQLNGGTYPRVDRLLQKAGYLLITHGQFTQTARMTAVAGDEKYVGSGWMPVIGLSPEEAKAVAVFTNSTAGRLQLMRNPGRTINYPKLKPRWDVHLSGDDDQLG